MPTLTKERADQLVTTWRTSEAPVDGIENPAGPLYTSGRYAQADITMTGDPWPGGTGHTDPCSACTGSGPIHCC